MKLSELGSVLAIAAMALLTACGGDATPEFNDGNASTAGMIMQGGAPVADCEAEGCNRPRIIDGLAEQYRFDAIGRAAEASEAAQASEQLPGPAPGQAAPSEPLPAAPEQAQ